MNNGEMHHNARDSIRFAAQSSGVIYPFDAQLHAIDEYGAEHISTNVI